MIGRVLKAYAREMEHYLAAFLYQPEGLVEVASISNQSDGEPGKLIFSLLGLERDSTQGITATVKVGSESPYGVSLPPVYMNMHIVIAAIYPDKRYVESLSVLSLAIAFIQSHPGFTVYPDDRYTIELMNASWLDMSNIWSGIGGRYYPSVICKIRRLAFSADEIRRTITDIISTDIEIL